MEEITGYPQMPPLADRGVASKWDPVVAHITLTRVISFDYTKGVAPASRLRSRQEVGLQCSSIPARKADRI
jgi:hypothetical protein